MGFVGSAQSVSPAWLQPPFFSSLTKDRRDFGFKDFSTMSMKARFQSQRRLKSLSKFADLLDIVKLKDPVFFGNWERKKRRLHDSRHGWRLRRSRFASNPTILLRQRITPVIHHRFTQKVTVISRERKSLIELQSFTSSIIDLLWCDGLSLRCKSNRFAHNSALAAIRATVLRLSALVFLIIFCTLAVRKRKLRPTKLTNFYSPYSANAFSVACYTKRPLPSNRHWQNCRLSLMA